MKKIFLFNSSKVKKLINELEKVYDCNLKHLLENFFYINKDKKLFMINNKIEEKYLKNTFGIGIYFGKFCGENFKLSFEGTYFVKPKKNYIILDDKNFEKYISQEKFSLDNSLKINKNNFPFLIVKKDDKNMGCCSIKENFILTYLKKNKRIKSEKFF